MNDLRVLVLCPTHQDYYVDRDAFGLIPGAETVYVSDNPELKVKSRARAEFQVVTYEGRLSFSPGSARLFRRIRDLEGLIVDLRPDIVVSFDIQSAISVQAGRLKRKFNFKHVISCYESAPLGIGLWSAFPPSFINALANRDSADIYIAHSRKIQSALRSVGVPESRILMHYPGVFVEDYSLGPHLDSRRPVVILYVGKLAENKGVRTLIDACGLLQRVSPWQFELTIAGTGDLKGYTLEMATRNLWINFVGRVSEEEKVRLLSDASIFVYPSITDHFLGFTRWEEQTGTSVLEAMSAGAPVIVSDSGSLPEIVDSPGQVFRMGSTFELADRLTELVSRSRLRSQLSKRNRDRALRNFDIHHYATVLRNRILRA